jgi:glyoxylase-like metal-dependent hydrolase (beta-lactamase superfamily II)
MTRAILLGSLIAVGGLSLAVSGQAPGPSAKAIDAMKIQKVKDNLYVIGGSGAEDQSSFSGGNVAVFVTEAGVTIVDAKLPGFGPTIVERVKSVTNKPITRIINTHTHGDHTGSNEFFGASIESIVQENTKANMVKMEEFGGAKAQFLPKKTYKDTMKVGAGKDEIDLYYFGRAHTNGDTFVVFPALRTMHVGDVFAWKALPYVDAANGGSVMQGGQTLGKLVAGVKNVDTIINGHIPTSSWNDLKEYQQFLSEFAAYAEKAAKAGKTSAQAAAEWKLDPKYKGYVASVDPQFGGARANMDIAFKEMGK